MLRLQFANVWTNDEDKALDFYTNKLGFKLVYDNPTPFGTRFRMFAPPEGGPGVVVSKPLPGMDFAKAGVRTNIAFETSDIQAAFEALKAKGVEFPQPPTKQPWGGVQAFFSDADGNVFQLNQV